MKLFLRSLVPLTIQLIILYICLSGANSRRLYAMTSAPSQGQEQIVAPSFPQRSAVKNGVELEHKTVAPFPPAPKEADSAPDPDYLIEMGQYQAEQLEHEEKDTPVRGSHIRTGSPVSVLEMSVASVDEPPRVIFAESPASRKQSRHSNLQQTPRRIDRQVPDVQESKPSRESFCTKVGRYACGYFSCAKEMMIGNCKWFFNKNWCKPRLRRAVGVAGAVGLYGGAAYLTYLYGPSYLTSGINSFAAFVVMNGLETALSFGALFMSTPQTAEPTPLEELRKLAVIIPVHGKTKNILPTLESLVKARFQLNQIFVMENTGGRYTYAESPTAALLQQERFRDVNYHFIGQWGSKVGAEFLGAVAAKALGFKYVMDIDDDVVVPPGFDPYLSLIKGKVKIIAYPITPSNNSNYLTDMQKVEYRRAARHNYFKQNLGTVLAPHGAVNVSDIDAYLEVMRLEPVGPFSAEDQRKGAAFRWSNYLIAMAPGAEVGTEVPNELATFWAQRVRSWDLGAHLCTKMYLEDLATDCPRDCSPKEWIQVFFRKLYQVQSIASNAADCVRPILMFGAGRDPYFWMVAAALWEANNLINFADDVCFKPHRERKPTCRGGSIVRSLGRHHMSFPYMALQLVNGSTAAFCAWVGAGAADANDYGLKKGYPEELAEILRVENAEERYSQLYGHLQVVGPDPRDFPDQGERALDPSPIPLNTIRRIYELTSDNVITDVTEHEEYRRRVEPHSEAGD